MFESNAALIQSDSAFAEEGETEVDIDWSVFNKELEDIKDQELLNQDLPEINEDDE
jgi:hypothetical protein